MRPQVQLPQRPDLVWRLATPGAIQIEDPLDAQDALARDRIFAGDRGLPQLAPAMRPAPDLLALGEVGLAVVGRQALIRGLEQQIVDALGVGLDVAGEAAEQLADGGRGLLGQVLDEDVIGVGDLDQEVAAAASAARLVAAGDRLDGASKVAALARAQLSKLGRFEQLEISTTDAEVVLRAVLTQAQTEALADTLGLRPSGEK